jgi:phytoene dehydrogenase-like protein
MTDSRAVVIGGGFGGLAAAVRLRARGYAVPVVEALDQPGGRARGFRRDGFTFDAGPTVVAAPYLPDELFALAGRPTVHARIGHAAGSARNGAAGQSSQRVRCGRQVYPG